MSTYKSDETTLYYRDLEAVPPLQHAKAGRAGGHALSVVFLHPTPADGAFWLPLIENLSGVRALAPDLRGHGRSELGQMLPAGGFTRVPDAPVLSMGQYASDILALLDRLEMKQAVFVGCSIGGYVLLELWRRAPERMRGLAFICSKPQPDSESNLAKREANIAQARAGGAAGLMDGFAQNLVGASARARNPALVRELRAQMTVTAGALVAVQAGLAARPDSVPTVASITVPVLAIAGGEDATVTPAEMEAFCAAPGGCTYELLPDAGHFAPYEQPGKVGAIVSEWLRTFMPPG